MWTATSNTGHLGYSLAIVLLIFVSISSGGFVSDLNSNRRLQVGDGAQFPKDSQFNEALSKEKTDNPKPTKDLTGGNAEPLWKRRLASDPETQSLEPHEVRALPAPANRTTAISTQIAHARDLIAKALEQIGRRNAYLSANPARNRYSLGRPSGGAARKRKRDDVPWVLTNEIRSAAALLAELEAEEMDRGGILHPEYRIAFKESPDGPVLHKTHSHTPSQLRARAGVYWLESLGKQHPGSNPFGREERYRVFRNVKDYGAVGDGKKDDTDAINKAISDGERCGENCGGSTIKGATVYFPPGTYLVSSSILAMYHTQLVGDPENLPIIKAAPSFTSLGVISSDVYTGQKNPRWGDDVDDEWYLNTANFFRQVRNFVIDITATRGTEIKGMHWQVAQATSLQNIHFKMKPGSTQIGLFIENGSDGFMGDLTFEGGAAGMLCGNQQFTSRDLIFEGCQNAIRMLWDWGWGWVWKGLDITGGEVGINFTTDGFPGGSITVVDSMFSGSKIGILMNPGPNESGKQAVIEVLNTRYQGVGTMVSAPGSGGAQLRGGKGQIDAWIIGNTYTDGKAGPAGAWSNGQLAAFKVPQELQFADSRTAGYYTRSKPQYANRPVGDWIIPTAKGDGTTDDTKALHGAFAMSAIQKRSVFLPAGSYMVKDTLDIPSGTIVVGSCWSQIVAYGKDAANPKVMVRVGKPGDVGTVELSDLLFTAVGPTAGLVAMEWNLKADGKGKAAMWDCHFRIGGAAGTGLQASQCPKLAGVKAPCIAGSLLLHLTSTSSAYLDNVWVWTADHDLDDTASLSEAQVDIYVARGILIESKGPTWLWATASEHNVLYQYALSNAEFVFLGLIQTESPYFYPTPSSPTPFEKTVGKFPADPKFDDCKGDKSCLSSWALILERSRGVHIVGAGLYSWFYDNYGQSCLEPMTCQKSLVSIDEASTASIYNLFTIGAAEMVNHRGSKPILAKDNLMLAGNKPWTSVVASWVKDEPTQIKFGAKSVAEEFWAEFPDHCKDIDRCAADADTTSRDPDQRILAATKGKGYLCLLDWAYEVCRNPPQNNPGAPSIALGGFDRCFYGKLKLDLGSCSNIDYLINTCSQISATGCHDYRRPELYWLMAVLSHYAHHAYMIREMVFRQTFTSSLTEIYKITDTITSADAKQGLTTKKILKIISQVLGFAAAAVPKLPIPGPMSSSARREAAGEFVGLVSMVFDTAQEHLQEESESEKKMKLHEVMEKALGTFAIYTEVQLRQNLLDYFQYADLTNWSKTAFPPEEQWSYKGGELSTLGERFSGYLRTAMVLVALAASGDTYYILKNPIWARDCPPEKKTNAFPSARMIDGNCYVLHRAGVGWKPDMGSDIQDAGAYSQEIGRNKVVLFSESDIQLLYRGSLACQAQYGYTKILDGQKAPPVQVQPMDFDPLTSCVFNLPVIDVSPKEAMKPHISTPCVVLDRRRNDPGAADVVGYNVLPEELQDVFTDRFCQTTCTGRTCALSGCPPPPRRCPNNTTAESLPPSAMGR